MSSVFARRAGVKGGAEVKTGVIISASMPVFLTAAGLAVPFASADGTSKFAGIASRDADNANGLNGDVRAEVEKQQCALLNTGDVTQAHIGSNVYFDSESSVSISDGGATNPLAGVVSELEGNLVWVQPSLV